jgi:hypothetical protein
VDAEVLGVDRFVLGERATLVADCGEDGRAAERIVELFRRRDETRRVRTRQA